MARQARIVVAGCPHHVVHRGNLRAQVFFSDDDRRFYLEMLRQCAERFGVAVWAYWLMGNHVHLIAVPEHRDSLARAVGLCHQRYASAVNARNGWTGNLWANRFFSSALDDDHLWRAVRYVELNPVRAGLVETAGEWEWSSARAHLDVRMDPALASGRPFPGQWRGEWKAFLNQELTSAEITWIRRNIATGRPTASRDFIAALEQETGKTLTPQPRGRKPKACGSAVDLTEDMFG